MKQSTQNSALKLAAEALNRTDQAIRKFASIESLPEPIACRPGCHYCCFNQPMVTPPEALLIGHHVDRTFSDEQKRALNERIREIRKKTSGKPLDEILMMRHELPCVFLQQGMCMVYGVRPVVCRTCSSTSAAHCETIFESRNHRARLRCYQQIREIFHTVHSQLIARCRKMGCQSEALQITAAMEGYFRHPSPVDAWLRGETVFQINV